MLQWMGGARRKVANVLVCIIYAGHGGCGELQSRKSTEKRQRQYFEQRKRQKQTAGLGSCSDEIIPCGEQVQLHDKPQSLDILSLLNLKTVTEESNSCRTTVSPSNASNFSDGQNSLNCPPCHTCKAKENPVFNNSPEFLKCGMQSITNEVCHKQVFGLKEAKNVPSNPQVDTESLKKAFSNAPDRLPSPENHSSDGKGAKLDCWRTATENRKEFSILDVLGDDGLDRNAEESPIREAHVAFSVEGLGKVGTETPVCSPRPSGRILLDGCPPRPKAKKFHSSKDFKYIMDDEELELNAMMCDINMPFGKNSSKIPSKSSNTVHRPGNPENRKLTFQGFMQPDAYSNQIDYSPAKSGFLTSNIADEGKYGVHWGNQSDQRDFDFDSLLGDGKHFHQSSLAFEDFDLHSMRAAERAVTDVNVSAKSGLLTSNVVDERKYGAHWGNQSDQRDSDFDFLLRDGKQIHQSSPPFQDFNLHSMRAAERGVSDVNIAGSPFLHSKYPASDEDHFSMKKNKPRYTSLDGSWDFGTHTDQAWSFTTEDAADSMSLLSEESCSSTAVRGDKCYNSVSISLATKKRVPREGNDNYKSSENNYGGVNQYAEELENQNQDEIQRGNNVKVPQKYPSMPKQMKSKLEDCSKELNTAHENLKPEPRWSFVDEYSSADKDLGLGSFCKISAEAEPRSWDLEFFSEDHSEPLSSVISNSDVPSKRGCAANKRAEVLQPPSPKNSYGSPIFSNTESSSKEPDVSPVARMEGKPPHSSDPDGFSECIEVQDISRWENTRKYHEEKSEFQHTYWGEIFEKIQKGLSVEKFELTSEIERASYDIDPNYNCGEHNVADDDTQPRVLKLKISSPDHAEEMSANRREKSDNFEKTIDVKKCQFGTLVHLSSPSWTKDVGADKDASRPKRRNTEGNRRNGNVSPGYQIMLQSYVQLLCVQKVLKEANEQSSLKKA